MLLVKRKRFYLNELSSQVEVVCYLLIGISYLRDNYPMPLILRLLSQWLIQEELSPEDQLSTSDEFLKLKLQKALIIVLFASFYTMFIHLIFGGPNVGNEGTGELHGGITIQFIGESLRGWSRWSLLLLDIVTLITQLLCFLLLQVVDKSQVMQPLVEDASDDDGGCGSTYLLALYPLQQLKEVITYRGNVQEAMYLPGLTRGIFSGQNQNQQQENLEQQQTRTTPNLPGFFPSQAFA